jgi:hypothetical protein
VAINVDFHHGGYFDEKDTDIGVQLVFVTEDN